MRNALFVTGSFFTFSYRVHTQSAGSDCVMRVTMLAPLLGYHRRHLGLRRIDSRPIRTTGYRRMARMYRPARLKTRKRSFPVPRVVTSIRTGGPASTDNSVRGQTFFRNNINRLISSPTKINTEILKFGADRRRRSRR